MSCRGACHSIPGAMPGRGPYVFADGRKACRRCEKSFKYEGRYCPCCGQLLAIKPQGKGARTKRARTKRAEEAFRY